MLTEPTPTSYDLHFNCFGVPVRIHPLFWLVALLLGFSSSNGDPKLVLLFVVAMFVSILVHEMGHAIAIRYYGWSPNVVLYSFGGLAIYNPYVQTSAYGNRTRRSTWTQVIISLAGPGAGFLLAGLIVLALVLTGTSTSLYLFGDAPLIRLPGQPPSNAYIGALVFFLLYINIFWGLLNLAPIFPLDGGKVAREIMVMLDGPSGVANSLKLSMAFAIGLAVFALINGMPFAPILFGLLAFGNYRELSGGNRFGGNPW